MTHLIASFLISSVPANQSIDLMLALKTFSLGIILYITQLNFKLNKQMQLVHLIDYIRCRHCTVTFYRAGHATMFYTSRQCDNVIELLYTVYRDKTK